MMTPTISQLCNFIEFWFFYEDLKAIVLFHCYDNNNKEEEEEDNNKKDVNKNHIPLNYKV